MGVSTSVRHSAVAIVPHHDMSPERIVERMFAGLHEAGVSEIQSRPIAFGAAIAEWISSELDMGGEQVLGVGLALYRSRHA